MKMHQLTLTTFKMKQFGVIYLLSALYLNVVFGEKNCDDLGLNFYRSIGCKESGKENGCPSYDGCQYSQPIGHCTYQGQKIDKGQAVKDVVKDSSCSFGCICTAADGEKGSFLCAQGHCGIDESILFGKSPNCFLRYSLDQCCPNSEPECAEESPATCKVGNEEFKEGKLFSPKDKCITCLCTKDFDGKLDGPNCQPTPCDVEVRHSQDIEKNCAPLYFINSKKSEALCCPVTFVCPSKIDVIKENDTKSTDRVCKYGLKTLKLGSTIETENDSYGKRKVHCECVSPPLMTCTMSY